MADNNPLGTILGIGISATLLFIYPVMSISAKNDDVAQQSYQKATVEFVDAACNVGSISDAKYNEYQEKLAATGYPADIKLEVKRLDDNVGKKTTWTSSSVLGENALFSEFTEQIEGQVYGPAGKYNMNVGNILSATATNKKPTLHSAMTSAVYSIVGRGTYSIKGQHAAECKKNGSTTDTE